MPIYLRVILAVAETALLFRSKQTLLRLYLAVAILSVILYRPFAGEQWWLHTWRYTQTVALVLMAAFTGKLVVESCSHKTLIVPTAWAAACGFLALSSCPLPPGALDRFVAIRADALLFMWSFALMSAICDWLTADERNRLRIDMWLWIGVLSCYALPALMDWKITTGHAWITNTTVWSLVLSAVYFGWALKPSPILDPAQVLLCRRAANEKVDSWNCP